MPNSLLSSPGLLLAGPALAVATLEPGPEVRSCEPRARAAGRALKSSFRALVRPLVARNQILFNKLEQNKP